MNQKFKQINFKQSPQKSPKKLSDMAVKYMRSSQSYQPVLEEDTESDNEKSLTQILIEAN